MVVANTDYSQKEYEEILKSEPVKEDVEDSYEYEGPQPGDAEYHYDPPKAEREMGNFEDVDWSLTYFTQEDITEFVDSFDKKSSEKISEYFKELPTITKTLEYKNEKGTARSITLSGLTDFFM